MDDPRPFGPADALIAVPGPSDDKYSRGVLGVITGSERYPGAAVLGVEAALRTGVGMLRYIGHPRAADLVLARRPEAVVGMGRVQAWVIGSGTEHAGYASDEAETAIAQGVPVVLDAGALALHERVAGALVVTPHAGELARVLDVDRAEITADPAGWALRAHERLGATVLLKGHTTHVVGPGTRLAVRSAPAWLATAGAGDALAGVLGALVATQAHAIAADERVLPRLAATASLIHGLAAERASAGGPLTILDLCAQVPATIAGLLGSGVVSR